MYKTSIISIIIKNQSIYLTMECSHYSLTHMRRNVIFIIFDFSILTLPESSWTNPIIYDDWTFIGERLGPHRNSNSSGTSNLNGTTEAGSNLCITDSIKAPILYFTVRAWEHYA